VFKCFCNDITDDGLMRMLRVIKKNLKPARHPDAGSADEDDDDEDDDLFNIEDEEIDQAETGETGESDGQTDDSESVVEADETGQDHPEDSDDSDSGMDDDAMFRMDTYLAQIFKEKKSQSGSETAHSQLLLFKLRILSLLEIFVHENPGKYTLLPSFTSFCASFVSVIILFSNCMCVNHKVDK
jgi:DNA polymerase phi